MRSVLWMPSLKDSWLCGAEPDFSFLSGPRRIGG